MEGPLGACGTLTLAAGVVTAGTPTVGIPGCRLMVWVLVLVQAPRPEPEFDEGIAYKDHSRSALVQYP